MPESVHSVVAVTHEESHKVTVRVRHNTGGNHQGRRRYLVGVEFVDVPPGARRVPGAAGPLGNGSLSVKA